MPKMLRCSFCRRTDAEVVKLVAGPRRLVLLDRVMICDRCASEAMRIMNESDAAPGRRAASAGPLRRIVRWVSRLRHPFWCRSRLASIT